jgi:serine/threonine-protein kinase
MQGAASSDRSRLALTAAGMVFGTPEFMSPEQACGQELDGRSDLYSLAATMFVMLTGTSLFEGKTAIELLTHQARTPAPHLAMVRTELAIYPELDDLLQRCLAKHRAHRPASAAEMATLLERLGPTLTRSVAEVPRVTFGQSPTPPAFHASSYFRAVPETAAEGVPGAPSRSATAPSLGLPRAVKRSRPGPTRWLVGAAIAMVLGVVIGVAVRTSRSASISTEPSTGAPLTVPGPGSAAEPAAGPGSVAGQGPVAGSGSAAAAESAAGPGSVAGQGPATTLAPPTESAAASSSPGRGTAPAPSSQKPGRTARTRKAIAAEHVRNAESAARAGEPLKQLIEANLALDADPRNVRARYLGGDALIKDRDLERGCKYLRAAKDYPPAQERARAAGCPGD